MIERDKWEWFGNPGHFICARWCRFHLCTVVGKYLISTVGEYVPPHASGGSEMAENVWLSENWPGMDVGHDRKFETMVFIAGKRCKCGLPEIKRPANELDFSGYKTRGDAARGHEAMCLKYAEMQEPQVSST